MSPTDPEEQLLAALHASPADDACWFALADVLEEKGQGERAELTRLLTWLRRHPDHPERPAREGRLRGLLAAGVRPRVPETVNSVGMRLALIPPGLFAMGSPDAESGYDDEKPVHPVAITRPFYLGVYAVTQAEYQAVAGTNPSTFVPAHPAVAADGVRDTGGFPAEGVTWEMAARFCRRLSARGKERRAGRVYRLPTEAEWEYACRAGTTTAYHFGDSCGAGDANFNATVPAGDAEAGVFLGRTCPVGCYAPNGFGLYDTHGNVTEWCADWHDALYYRDSPHDDPAGPVGGRMHVFRGGCWRYYAQNCRAAYRYYRPSTSRESYDGLRVAMTVVPAPGA